MSLVGTIGVFLISLGFLGILAKAVNLAIEIEVKYSDPESND